MPAPYSGAMPTPTDALTILQAHPAEVARECAVHRVVLLTAFGSVLRPGAAPRDLDLGVLFEHAGPRDVLGLLDGLVELTGFDGIDLAVLNGAGPVIRERALVGALVLFEAGPSVHANAAIAATMERMDTAWMRELARREMAR